jgi:oligopeptide transport system substrate-binding protein
VRALDRFTLEVDLERPTDFFLTLLDSPTFYAVPRLAIESAEKRGSPGSWTDPRYIITDGPFKLEEWRPYEQITVRKNQGYFESGLVGLDEILFLPISDNLTCLNLFKAGEADILQAGIVPRQFFPKLRKGHDFESASAREIEFLAINTKTPPLDNLLIRYALNMSIDKMSIAALYNDGETPARTLTAPGGDVQSLVHLPVVSNGKTYDVISFDVLSARELLAFAGFPGGRGKEGRPLSINLYGYTPDTMQDSVFEVLRQQWRSNLGIDLAVSRQEFSEYYGSLVATGVNGLGWSGWATGVDAATLFDIFAIGPSAAGTNWRSDRFSALASEARETVGSERRMAKASEVERYLLQQMPVIPLVHGAWQLMKKPYVHGLPINSAYKLRFKYAWVDTSR